MLKTYRSRNFAGEKNSFGQRTKRIFRLWNNGFEQDNELEDPGGSKRRSGWEKVFCPLPPFGKMRHFTGKRVNWVGRRVPRSLRTQESNSCQAKHLKNRLLFLCEENAGKKDRVVASSHSIFLTPPVGSGADTTSGRRSMEVALAWVWHLTGRFSFLKRRKATPKLRAPVFFLDEIFGVEETNVYFFPNPI